MQLFTIGLKGLPFVPDTKQIIYVENTYNDKVNRFIKRNYKRICSHFIEYGYEFCYLPLIHERLSGEVYSYYNPLNTAIKPSALGSDFLLNYMAHPENRVRIGPSLLFVNEDIQGLEDGALALRGILLENVGWRDRRLAEVLYAIREDRDPAPIRYRRAWPEDANLPQIEGSPIADTNDKGSKRMVCQSLPIPEFDDAVFDGTDPKGNDFDPEIASLFNEVAEKINQLKQRGISLYVLERMLQAPIKPSRMVITSDYRILLPEYNNMEIEMTPLVKAVYFLFLRHPEGVIFKHLPDYYEELSELYCKIKGETLDEKMEKSVKDVTNPHENSINEKVARIREAFITRFDERLAEQYMVLGRRGEPKIVSLPRELIEWREGGVARE